MHNLCRSNGVNITSVKYNGIHVAKRTNVLHCVVKTMATTHLLSGDKRYAHLEMFAFGKKLRKESSSNESSKQTFRKMCYIDESA